VLCGCIDGKHLKLKTLARRTKDKLHPSLIINFIKGFIFNKDPCEVKETQYQYPTFDN